ncbi:MAG: hypothetical protein FWE76_02640 [Symbiobacteriaceae bacterium]|nr:hypothetical protein [Symbiobacteriaceae bacterium]
MLKVGELLVSWSYPAGYPVVEEEMWTAKQRQMSSLHEISYRACFKAELPAWFIDRYSQPGDIVYDPFSGRGTTVIQASLSGRRFISNDLNPLSRILTEPRISPPPLAAIALRLDSLDLQGTDGMIKPEEEPDLEVFYNARTLMELRNLRNYLQQRRSNGREDALDAWIRMVATNRLSGHSKGFFSVYTLPPNQATNPERQRTINHKYNNDFGEYKDVKSLILRKSRSLLKTLPNGAIGMGGVFLTCNAADTPQIPSRSVNLIITSPPFLNVVQYEQDNWLRIWFNCLDRTEITTKLTKPNSLKAWKDLMARVFAEFARIMTPGGYIAFEVGEINKGKTKLDEMVYDLVLDAGLLPEATLINSQIFSKTSNIWGVRNNTFGTNSNRIVLFRQGI